MALFMIAIMTSCSKDEIPTELDGNSLDLKMEAGAVLTTVNLGSAAKYAILTKSGITDVFPSAITGNVGSSPITGAAILLSCTEVTGLIYTVDAAGPLPCRITNATKLTSAIGSMELRDFDQQPFCQPGSDWLCGSV